MNAFEDIVRRYLEEKGYWVRQSVKVKIPKQDKVAIGTPTMPTPEIDLVALHVKQNELLLIEVKSFLDSYGVWVEAVTGEDSYAGQRYKLFTNNSFRRSVTRTLKTDYLKRGLINPDIQIRYALAAGHIHSGNEDAIAKYFQKRKWILFRPAEIKEYVKELLNKGWEDDLVTMAAKLILR